MFAENQHRNIALSGQKTLERSNHIFIIDGQETHSKSKSKDSNSSLRKRQLGQYLQVGKYQPHNKIETPKNTIINQLIELSQENIGLEIDQELNHKKNVERLLTLLKNKPKQSKKETLNNSSSAVEKIKLWIQTQMQNLNLINKVQPFQESKMEMLKVSFTKIKQKLPEASKNSHYELFIQSRHHINSLRQTSPKKVEDKERKVSPARMTVNESIQYEKQQSKEIKHISNNFESNDEVMMSLQYSKNIDSCIQNYQVPQKDCQYLNELSIEQKISKVKDIKENSPIKVDDNITIGSTQAFKSIGKSFKTNTFFSTNEEFPSEKDLSIKPSEAIKDVCCWDKRALPRIFEDTAINDKKFASEFPSFTARKFPQRIQYVQNSEIDEDNLTVCFLALNSRVKDNISSSGSRIQCPNHFIKQSIKPSVVECQKNKITDYYFPKTQKKKRKPTEELVEDFKKKKNQQIAHKPAVIEQKKYGRLERLQHQFKTFGYRQQEKQNKRINIFAKRPISTDEISKPDKKRCSSMPKIIFNYSSPDKSSMDKFIESSKYSQNIGKKITSNQTGNSNSIQSRKKIYSLAHVKTHQNIGSSDNQPIQTQVTTHNFYNRPQTFSFESSNQQQIFRQKAPIKKIQTPIPNVENYYNIPKKCQFQKTSSIKQIKENTINLKKAQVGSNSGSRAKKEFLKKVDHEIRKSIDRISRSRNNESKNIDLKKNNQYYASNKELPFCQNHKNLPQHVFSNRNIPDQSPNNKRRVKSSDVYILQRKRREYTPPKGMKGMKPPCRGSIFNLEAKIEEKKRSKSMTPKIYLTLCGENIAKKY